MNLTNDLYLVTYLLVGVLFSSWVIIASRKLPASWPAEAPWYTKLVFPLHITLRERDDPITFGTVFWNRGGPLEFVGMVVMCVWWPVRLLGSLCALAVVGMAIMIVVWR